MFHVSNLVIELFFHVVLIDFIICDDEFNWTYWGGAILGHINVQYHVAMNRNVEIYKSGIFDSLILVWNRKIHPHSGTELDYYVRYNKRWISIFVLTFTNERMAVIFDIYVESSPLP